MNDKIKRFTFYNIFFLCAFLCLFMVLSEKSFGSNSSGVLYIDRFNPDIVGTGYEYIDRYYYLSFDEHIVNSSFRSCVVTQVSDGQTWFYIVCPDSSSLDFYLRTEDYNGNLKSNDYYILSSHVISTAYGDIRTYPDSNNVLWLSIYNDGNMSYTVNNVPSFDNFNDAANYVLNGVVPEIPFDETLKLDSFKITSWQVGTSQLVFRSKLEVVWSDSRIANVQVKIVGTANSPTTFESNSSPFKQKFYASNYVMKNGDVIHFTATPFKSNGEYGESLYYSIVYEDGLPSNWYRKFVNTPYNDNTLTIPYNDVSGQPQSVTLPVDGVTTNNVYKVNYNPVTNEYGDLNLYNIYYSPVLVYPDDTPEEEIDDTQEVVNNTYTTNNYYETTKNFNINFDVSFGDISGSDIQIGYDDTGNFLNSFGKLISKLSTWVLALFPFLPPIVATSIVVVFGLVVSVAIIVFALKIASVIADFIDAIIPG